MFGRLGRAEEGLGGAVRVGRMVHVARQAAEEDRVERTRGEGETFERAVLDDHPGTAQACHLVQVRGRLARIGQAHHQRDRRLLRLGAVRLRRELERDGDGDDVAGRGQALGELAVAVALERLDEGRDAAEVRDLLFLPVVEPDADAERGRRLPARAGLRLEARPEGFRGRRGDALDQLARLAIRLGRLVEADDQDGGARAEEARAAEVEGFGQRGGGLAPDGLGAQAAGRGLVGQSQPAIAGERARADDVPRQVGARDEARVVAAGGQVAQRRAEGDGGEGGETPEDRLAEAVASARGALGLLLAEEAVSGQRGEVALAVLWTEEPGGVAVPDAEDQELALLVERVEALAEGGPVRLLRGGAEVGLQLVPAEGGQEGVEVGAAQVLQVEEHGHGLAQGEVLVPGVLQDLTDEAGDLRAEGAFGDVPAEAGAGWGGGVEDPGGGGHLRVTKIMRSRSPAA